MDFYSVASFRPFTHGHISWLLEKVNETDKNATEAQWAWYRLIANDCCM